MTDRCKRCGAFDFFGKHQCPPAWRAYVHGSPETALTVYSYDGEDAAEKFMAEYCMEGERFEDGGTVHVVVENESSGDPPPATVYTVSMSLTWSFSADYHSEPLETFDPEDVWW